MKRAMLFRAGLAACVITLTCAAPRARAGIHPAGDEFEIAATGDKVAASMDGLSRLVVAWRDFDEDLILLQRFQPTGEPIGPIEVVRDGWEPEVTLLDVRVACGLDGSCPLPYSLRFCFDPPNNYCVTQGGIVIRYAGGQRVVRDPGTEAIGEVAADGSGAFAIVRRRTEWYPYPRPVLLSRYDAVGTSLGPTIQLSAGLGAAEAPRIAADGSGRYLVLWTERAADDYLWHLAQRITPDGQLVGPMFDIGTYDAVCSDAAGRAITVHAALGIEGQRVVFASRFGADGVRQWGPVPISSANAALARVACDAAGGFVAAWRRMNPEGGCGVFARRYTAGNTPDGPEFQVNQASATPSEIAVTADPRGNFAVLWRSTSIRARRFTVDRPSVRQGDIDCDGQTDLVLARALDGHVRVWTMSEAQRLGNWPLYPDSPDPDWTVVGVDDFSGDGHNDLLLRHGDDGALAVWLLGGEGGVECLGSMPLSGAAPLSSEWDVAATGDFTLDSWPDIVWQERATGRLIVWTTANGAHAGARAPVPDRATDGNWRVVAAQDFDGDGKRDLLWFNTTSGRLVQWLLDAGLRRQAGRFTNPAEVSDANWQVVAAGDYGVGPGGLPGTNDVVWRNVFSGRLVVWFLDLQGNRTAGTFTNPAAPSDPLAWTVVGPR